MLFRACIVATLLAAGRADDLVAAIKHGLQQNNDDYADLRRARALTSPPRASPSPSSVAEPSSAPLASATPKPVAKLLFPVEKQPHLDKSPSAALRRASSLNDSLEVVKVASWYTSFTPQRPKIILPAPIIAEISVAGSSIGPKISKKSVFVNGIEPIMATKSVDRKGMGPIIKQKSVGVNVIQPNIATKAKSEAVKTLTSSRQRAHPVGRARARPAHSQRGNHLAPRERALRGKGVEKSSSIDREYYKDLDNIMKLGRVSKAAAAHGARQPVMRASWKHRERIRQKMRQQAHGRARGAHKRLRGAGSLRADDAELPPAEVLDMAPAVGARVYSKRLRHRLCSRSVLNPEGPKYNRAGQIYDQPFTPRGLGHYGFNQTREPRLLLPRCCNCCKKSVLGCE